MPFKGMFFAICLGRELCFDNLLDIFWAGVVQSAFAHGRQATHEAFYVCVTNMSNCYDMYCDKEIIEFCPHAVFFTESCNNNMFVNELNFLLRGQNNLSSCKDLGMLGVVGLSLES